MREISRKVKLAQTSVIKHLKELERDGLIIKEKNGIYPAYKANMQSDDFKLLKKQNVGWRMHKTGLISFLDDKIKPNCMVLFGSASRGEDAETSDIDIFIQAEETNLNLEKYERLLSRKIKLFFEAFPNKLSKELLNNIINGNVIYGYLKVL